MGDEDMPHGMDTTICLVQNLATEAGSPLCKKRKKGTESTESDQEKVGKIYADSRRLRQCSRYFDMCMNESGPSQIPCRHKWSFVLNFRRTWCTTTIASLG